MDHPRWERVDSRLREERQLRGLTQEEVAASLAKLAWEREKARVGVDAAMVSKWERGEKRPSRLYRKLLCVLFKASEEQLGLRPMAVSEWSRRINPESLQEGDSDMKRRDCLRYATFLGAAALLPTEPWDRLARALSRRAADAADVGALQAHTATLFDLEEQLPARHLFGRVMKHLDGVIHLLESPLTSAARRRLASTAGETAALAGWLAFDMSDAAKASSFYAAATEAATEGDDPDLVACVLGYRSYLASADGAPAEARNLLQEAQRQARGLGKAATIAWLAAREAEESACLADDAALTALDRAESAFATADPNEQRPWTRFLDSSRLRSLAIATHVRLNRPAAAQHSAEIALRSLPASEDKKRSIILTDVATAYAQQGHIDEACRVATDALAIGTRTESSVAVRRLREFRARLEPWATLTPVREFDEQLALAV